MKRAASLVGWIILSVLLLGVGYRKVLAVRANSILVQFTMDRRAQSERYAPRFLSDKLAWKRIELFNPPPVPSMNARNAGEWLDRRVTWLPAGTAEGSGSAPKSALLKGFAAQIRDPAAFVAGADKLSGWLDEWAQHSADLFPPGKIPFADFSWIPALEAYTHWDIDSSEKAKTALSLNTKLLTGEMPEPSWGELETWGQLRLLHGIAMRNLAPAIRDSRTLVRLLLTTERMGAVTTAVRLLKREAQAERVYRERVDPRFAPTALQFETIAGIEGYLQAFPAMLDSTTDPDALSEAFLADGSILGLCAELNALSARILRDRVLLSDAYAFAIDTIGRILKDPGNRCRLPRLKRLWDQSGYLPPPLSRTGWEPAPIPELPGFLLVSDWFDYHNRISEAAGLAGLPPALRGSSAVRRAEGVVLKRSDDEGVDPWSRYARQK